METSKQRYLRRHPERRRLSVRAYHLKRTYGISLEDWDEMFVSQGGCCKICTKELFEPKTTTTDHDHGDGHVRGILCTKCNALLGKAEDSVDTLESAIAYLKEDRDGRD